MSQIKLVSLNIEGNKHFNTVFPFLTKTKPDVLCLQEVYQAHLPLFQQKLNLKTAHFYPMCVIDRQHPLNFPLLGQWGLAILTSLPSTPPQVKHYKKKKNKLPFLGYKQDLENRMLLWTTITKNSASFTIATTHFNWSFPKNADQYQAPYLKKLLNILSSLPEFIFCGDLNAPRGQKIYNTLAKKYQDNIPANIKTTIDPRLHRRKNLKLVVDCLFTTPHYQAKNVKIQCSVSDHCAVIADLTKSV